MDLRVIAGLALAFALTACGTTVPGTPVPAAPKLDTGNYPAVPRTVKAATATDAWQQESWNIGDYVVAPWDIDPAFTYAPAEELNPLALVFSPPSLAGDNPFSVEQADQLWDSGLQAGFRTAFADSEGGARTIGAGILRFSQSTTAAAAIRVLTAAPTPQVPPALAAIPGTSVLKSTTAPSGTSIYTATARDNLIILAGVTGAPNAQRAVDLLGRTITAQIDKAKGYRQTPYRGGIPDVEMDHLGIEKRTILGYMTAEERELSAKAGLSADVQYEDGYRSARANSLAFKGYAQSEKFSKLGVEWWGGRATARATVLRMSGAEAARAFREERGADSSCAPDLPAGTVSCDTTSNSTEFRCTISRGRWVAITFSATKPMLAQKCNAQYLIFKAAGDD